MDIDELNKLDGFERIVALHKYQEQLKIQRAKDKRRCKLDGDLCFHAKKIIFDKLNYDKSEFEKAKYNIIKTPDNEIKIIKNPEE